MLQHFQKDFPSYNLRFCSFKAATSKSDVSCRDDIEARLYINF